MDNYRKPENDLIGEEFREAAPIFPLADINTPQFAPATDLIKRAVKLMPSNGYFRDSLGWAYFKTGDLVGAERELLQAAKANPNAPGILEHLGDLYRKMERKPDALSYWKAALVLAKDEEARVRLQVKIMEQ